MADSRIPRGTERCRPVMMTVFAQAFTEAPFPIAKGNEHSIRSRSEQATALVSPEKQGKKG